MRAVRAVALAALAAGCAETPGEPAGPAAFAPPPGCELLATVRQRGCAVVQVTSCVAEPGLRVSHEFVQGEPREVVTTRGAVETRVQRADGSAFLFDRDDRDPGVAFDPAAPDAAAEVRGLVRRPRDLAVLAVVRDRFAAAGPAEAAGRPLARLLRETAYETEGRVATVTGDLFFDPALGAPVGYVIRNPDGAIDRSPLSVAGPGEEGFGSLAPAAGCPA